MGLEEEPINLPVGQNDGGIVYLDLIGPNTWHARIHDILILSFKLYCLLEALDLCATGTRKIYN